jgi:hypothetical protein
MKYKYIFSIVLATVCAFSFVGCSDDDLTPVEELNFSRVLAPIGIEAFVRNQTTIELRWKLRKGVDTYVVEISKDSMEFKNIILTEEVSADELPYQVALEGDTRYSARVKAKGDDSLDDSKWTAITVVTDIVSILLPLPGENVEDTYATIPWQAGSDVTHFLINPGNLERPITDDEKAAGEATLENLQGNTTYTVTLYNGDQRRGIVTFSTIAEANVFPEDDLAQVIADAEPGAELILAGGVYQFADMITINKSITIAGQRPHDKPVLNVAFTIAAGTGDVTLRNLELDGESWTTTFNLVDAGSEYGTITLEGCNIHDYGRQLIYGNAAVKLAGFVVNDCIVSNFVGSGGDFIDFRTAYVGEVTLTNSTFFNSPPARDFIRIDAAGAYTGTGLTTTVLIDHCTLYGVANSADRILYVRFADNVLTVRKTLIAATDGYFTNQPTTSQPTCVNNNYFNADGFFTPDYVSNAKHDNSGTHLTLDPGFVDAANGDFTVTNQDIIDAQIGDPRWR